MAKGFTPQVVTANRLRSGDVVYLAANDDWIRDVSRASVANDADQLTTLEATAARSAASQLVVGIYAFDVDTAAGRPVPRSVKERIRAAGGPTV